jgi:PTH1 family peptidyl-tRNA hydrolase
MILVAGLGNPGEEYENTRHNTGFIMLDFLAGAKDWNESGKANAFIKKVGSGKKEIEFIKPQTFMNNSGVSVKFEATKNKVKPEKVVVIYDDMDLPIGKIKISFNRSSGGHNGVESLIKQLKTQEFLRIRVGISPHTPTGKIKKPSGEKAVLDFLLKDFKDVEIAELKKISKKIKEALDCFVTDGKDKMMSLYN